MVEFVGLSEEMIAMLSIHGPDDPTQGYWKVVRVEIRPKTDNMSAFVAIPGEARLFTAKFFWGDEWYRADSKADPYAPEGVRINAASMPMFNAWGSYGVRIIGNSESIFGFGLYGENLDIHNTSHRPVLIFFEWHEGEEPPPPPGEARLVSPWTEAAQIQVHLNWLDELGYYLRPELDDLLKSLTIEVAD